MLLIYTQKISPRIVYIFKHICTHMLGLETRFTTRIEEFIAHPEEKFSYGKKKLGNELFVQSTDLLTEQGLNDIEIKVQNWEETKCFFAVSEQSDLPYDIFSASFYLLSRYEEYLPHVKDDLGRFSPSESLAYKEGFLEYPVVDIWAKKFKRILAQRFPELVFKERNFKAFSIISVSHVFNFKNKGVLRTVAGFLIDLWGLRLSLIRDRIQVLLRLKKDPYNVFDELISLLKEHKIPMLFMFQLSDFSAYDRNISHNRLNYKSIIKYVADYSHVGLRLGYFAIRDLNVLKTEKKRFENIIHGPLQNVINSKYNLMLPDHYGYLNELEISNDYSMGYPEAIGFRAGTGSEFMFYDINHETTTPLKVHPYAFHSQVSTKLDEAQLKSGVAGILHELKEVGGTFAAVFKNRDFSEYNNPQLFYGLLKQINEIR